MRKYLTNERGNAVLYMIWLLGIVALIFVLLINLVKVYVIKEQSSLSADQAALAGTSIILAGTKEAIKDFDQELVIGIGRSITLDKSLEQEVAEKQQEWVNTGLDESSAYIKAVNELVPAKMEENPIIEEILKEKFRGRLGDSVSELQYSVLPDVTSVLVQNGAKEDQTELVMDTSKWRLEVKTAVAFESISDNKYIAKFVEDVPQKGYGPNLKYLETIY
ncbi:hypothetical protein [Mangrovibacillus cuniculi]|uniref:Uncharacterized protein n=1 Tax=Mangrovibacillus cuniculi TaxID=2593652 RepID=A0A7S8CE74_9BACI|nr:hypothetical protein [Mangrovibacillus cuniculi]QPC48281.1 hypothetical protein G8O30_15825 [Mangrovibacillus cuniculi]